MKKISGKRINNWLLLIHIILGMIVLFAHMLFYPNRLIVVPELEIKTITIVENGGHNGFPDLMHWRDHFYLAFRSAKNHISQDSSIRILRSDDALIWHEVAELKLGDEDIRDPKFAVVHGELFLYALKNKELAVMPYTTIFSTSLDGLNWSVWQDVAPKNWVFWRPKTIDGARWYVAADNRKGKESALFTSIDGIHWDKVSTIYSGEFNAEVELTFLANCDLLATIRVEGFEGDPRTLIGHAAPPYQTWQLAASHLTRLDGASSIAYNDKVFSAGRYERKTLFRAGNLLNQKRTSLFEVKTNKLVWLSDLPSAGDTGYSSVLVVDGKAYIAYYTSDPNHDYPWIIGQFQPTQIWLTQIDLGLLEALANEQ